MIYYINVAIIIMKLSEVLNVLACPIPLLVALNFLNLAFTFFQWDFSLSGLLLHFRYSVQYEVTSDALVAAFPEK